MFVFLLNNSYLNTIEGLGFSLSSILKILLWKEGIEFFDYIVNHKFHEVYKRKRILKELVKVKGKKNKHHKEGKCERCIEINRYCK